MEVYNNLSELPIFPNAVITIGSFDGIHKGHQKLFERIRQLADDSEGTSVVITFHPHPRIVLRPNDSKIRLITAIDEKVALLEKIGIDVVVVVPFNQDFLKQTPDEYIQQFLLKRFQPKYIVIGYDHKFGKNRAGDINYLKRYQQAGNFEVIEIQKQEVENITVSSSKIRKALDAGEMDVANQLLGHPFTISGTVVKGEGIGNTLGFPTANVETPSTHKLIPREGIYAIRVHHKEQIHDGVLYIGKRPTIEGVDNRTIEAHIFDFGKDIYGDPIKLEFVSFIRGDAKFEGLEALQKQMVRDAQAARNILKKKPTESLVEPQAVNLPEVAVVILNYNGRDLLEKFIPSVIASAYPNIRIIVADNGSTDDSLEYLARFSEVEILELKENHGFAKGYNLALSQIDSPYQVLLNSDVKVSPGWLQPLVTAMEEDLNLGVCQPKVRAFHEPSFFEYAGAAGGMIDVWGYPFCRGRIFDTLEEDKGQYETDQEIFWASGAAFMIRRSLYEQLEGLDADYFAHHEEIDLCWRIKRAGYKIKAIPSSVVYHVGGGTLDYGNERKVFLNFRNSLYNLIKNESPSKLLWLIPWRLVLDGIAGIMFILKGQFKSCLAIIQAHFAMYKNYSKMKRKRRHYDDLIQKVSISPSPNLTGMYSKSIIWQYYIRRKKTYNKL